MVYPVVLPLMRTPRLPVVDWTDAPADLNRLVRFAERRNLVSARVITFQLASNTRTSQSVQRLAKDCTVRDSDPDEGERFSLLHTRQDELRSPRGHPYN